jgi:hypothetical protein
VIPAERDDRRFLAQVAEKLSQVPSSTDRLMLVKSRVLLLCQSLLDSLEKEVEEACRSALQAFVSQGPGADWNKALDVSWVIIRRLRRGTFATVLPPISKDKRHDFSRRLGAFAVDPRHAIETAQSTLVATRERVSLAHRAVSLPGIRHRFEQVAEALDDPHRPERDRVIAAAGILYVGEISDGASGMSLAVEMMDADFALRIVLEEVLDENHRQLLLHWSERTRLLWDDLPFLRGMNLQKGDSPVRVSWLDRLNSYVSYDHVLKPDLSTLVLLQPSTECSPLHTIVSLMGVIVLDAITSSDNRVNALRPGQTYEIDGVLTAQFEGIADAPMPGWLRLRVRDGIVYQPPGLAERMVPVGPRRLSSGGEYSSGLRDPPTDPIQQFFNWHTAIGAASIARHLALVMSRGDAVDLFKDVQSNGVHLLDHGLVRFVGSPPVAVETHGTLIFVMPSLSVTRQLIEQGVKFEAILIEGYERLHRGRHDLPFLTNGRGGLPIICRSVAGYYPVSSPAWLPSNRCLDVPSDDLADIVELDGGTEDVAYPSLIAATKQTAIDYRVAPGAACEASIAEAIGVYLETLRASPQLPDYFRYQLANFARTLRVLVRSTPAQWSEIRNFASAWSVKIEEVWSSLRPGTISALSNLRDAEKQVLNLIGGHPDKMNSHGLGLLAITSEGGFIEAWRFVCDSQEQSKVAKVFVRANSLTCVEPIQLQNLPVCSNCVVAGWVSTSFAQRLWSHAPRSLVAIVDETDRRKWDRVTVARLRTRSQSLIGAVEGLRPAPVSLSQSVRTDEHSADRGGESEAHEEELEPCVFLWLSGRLQAKVLAQDAHVVVEHGDVIRERVASRLRPSNRVILGSGSSRWSPADEFTEAVVQAVKLAHPELVKAAREWRSALHRFRDEQQLSIPRLLALLKAAGVERGAQTLEGWLELDRASPIAPRGLRHELASLWPLIEGFAQRSLEEVTAACERLRSLRAASGRALLRLWKGRTSELGIDERWLGDLVDQVREEVQVYEVDAVTMGAAPAAVLGAWLSPELVRRFEVVRFSSRQKGFEARHGSWN